MFLLAIVVTMKSCQKEESSNESPIEQSNELESDIESDFLEGEQFVITDTGERVSHDEYIKQLDELNSNILKKESVVSRIPISRNNMESLGMSFRNSRNVINRIQNSIFDGAPLNMLEVKGVLVNSRPFGNSFICKNSPCRNQNQSKFVFTRKSRGKVSDRRIEGPYTLTVREEKGLKNEEVSMGRRVIYEYSSATQSSITKTKSTSVNFGFKYGVSVSASFLGSGSTISSEISFGSETSNSTSTTKGVVSTRKDNIPYSPGDVIPKGKKCFFRVMGEKREVTRRYRVWTNIESNMIIKVKRPRNGNKIVFRNGEGKYAFPKQFRENRVYHDFDVKNQYWFYSIVRENCRNL